MTISKIIRAYLSTNFVSLSGAISRIIASLLISFGSSSYATSSEEGLCLDLEEAYLDLDKEFLELGTPFLELDGPHLEIGKKYLELNGPYLKLGRTHLELNKLRLRLGEPYLKLMVTGSRMSDIKTKDPEMNFSLDHKSNITPSFGVGIGYYLSRLIRMEMMLENLYFTFDEQSSTHSSEENGATMSGLASVRRKASGTSLMLNTFFDLIEYKKIKIFTGVGLGCSRLKETVSANMEGFATHRGVAQATPHLPESFTNKVKNKLAYSLMAGTSLYVTPRLDVDLIYSWRNLGTLRHNDIASNYSGHNVSVATIYKF